MFTSLTLLPVYFADPPYNLSETFIGMTYIPIGVTQIIGAVGGGTLSDYSRKMFPQAPEGLMIYPLIISAISLAPGAIGFGYAMVC